MAEGNFAQGSEEYVMFADFWKLCKKYWIPEKSDEWWDEVLKEIDRFIKKYGSTAFVRGLGLALVDELEAKYLRLKEVEAREEKR